jgi:hypothetical protein
MTVGIVFSEEGDMSYINPDKRDSKPTGRTDLNQARRSNTGLKTAREEFSSANMFDKPEFYTPNENELPLKRIQPVFYRGNEIIRFDLRGLEEEQDVIDFLCQGRDYLFKIDRPTLQLTNITGVYFTPLVMSQLSELAKEWEHLIIKDAIIGVTGVKKILFQIYNAVVRGKSKAFDDEETAKEWLAEKTY